MSKIVRKVNHDFPRIQDNSFIYIHAYTYIHNDPFPYKL